MSNEGFAAVPNWLIRDKTVSLYAIAVYTALASHSGPGGIHPSQATLAVEARCSERQVRRALVELEELAVVERVMRKNKKGRASSGYTLHPNGRLAADEERVEVPDSQSGTGVVPDSQSGGSGLGEQLVPYIEEEPLNKNPSLMSPEDPEALFEAAWKHWPRGDKKKNARDKFLRLKNQVEVAAAIVEHGDAHAKYSGQFVPHLITWLNGERWNDPLPGPRAGAVRQSTVAVGRSADQILREREADRARQAVGA